MTYPVSPVENEAGKIHGSSSNVARTVAHESVVEKTDLHKILADRPSLNIIVVRLGDASKEVHGVRIAKIVVQGAKDETLGT
jgi:hypothetical protein